MPYTVDFNTVSTVGLESSRVAAALAGLRANEARYFKNKYDHVFTVEPASDAQTTVDWVHRILREERHRHLVSPSRGHGLSGREHPNGLRVLREWPVDKRDVHHRRRREASRRFKLSEGMEVPAELASPFVSLAKSKLAGVDRGSYFTVKSEY